MPASSPLKRNARSSSPPISSRDRGDEAIKILKDVNAESPKDIEAIHGARNIERGARSLRCAATYSQAIEALPPAGDKNSWVTITYRGICEERSAVAKAEPTCARRSKCSPSSPVLTISAIPDRPGHQSRRRHEDDQARRRSAS